MRISGAHSFHGFMSGYQIEKGKDNVLLSRINGEKTLTIIPVSDTVDDCFDSLCLYDQFQCSIVTSFDEDYEALFWDSTEAYYFGWSHLGDNYEKAAEDIVRFLKQSKQRATTIFWWNQGNITMSEIRRFKDAMQIYEDCEVCPSFLISDQAKAFFALVLCKKGTNRQNIKSGADSNVVHAKTENRSDKKRTHLFIYRMTSDTGFAPCVDWGILTLACCKGGQIRQGKVIHTGLRHKIGSKDKVNYVIEDVYILGTYHDKFLYLAKVNQVMTMQKYFSEKRPGRTDDIYSVENGKLVRNEYLREEKVHIEPDRIKKDLAGDYVLSSVEYVYLGRDAVFIDIVAENNARFQETKYYCGEKAEQIIAACMKYKDGRQHTPTNPYPSHGGCR